MARKDSRRKKPARKTDDSVCEKMKAAAAQIAGEHGFEIMNMRCSLMTAMFVPGGRPERKSAFTFTIVGKDGKK